MISTYKADILAREMITKKMGLISLEQGVIGNKAAKKFLFWVPINNEKTIWITGEIFTNSDGIIISFYCNKIFRDIEKKNYSEILKNAVEKISKLNGCQELKKDGKNIIYFNINYHGFPALICIHSIIIIDYNMNEKSFQKEFREKLQEIIDIIKKKWPYDLLE
jgi:hypothetical protein